MLSEGLQEPPLAESCIWRETGLLQEVQFRATCAMSGQWSAACNRVLGNTDASPADASRRFLGAGLQGPPYPCTHPCKRPRANLDQKTRKAGLERHSRAKRPRETATPTPKQLPESCPTQQHSLGGPPYLPDDLYEESAQPSGLADVHMKFSKPMSHASPTPLPAALFQQRSRQSLQQYAAIAAFRPEAVYLSSPKQKAQSETAATASVPANGYPSAADADVFSAALSANAEILRHQQQSYEVVELPFPGMHTLDLRPPFAQPAVYEAVQQLLDHPGDYLHATACCPLSQAEMNSPVIVADGFTYDHACIAQWIQEHHISVL